MKEEKIREAIKKYRISLYGEDQISIEKPPKSKKIKEEIKAAKTEIIAELRRQVAENRKVGEEIKRKQAEIDAEYLATTDLRRCLIWYQCEYGEAEQYIATLEYNPGDDKGKPRMFNPRKVPGLFRRVSLDYSTDTMENIRTTQKGVFYGLGGVAWEITPEQEAQIIADQGPAQEIAEKKAVAEKTAKEAAMAEREAEKESERQAKFAEAKASGKPVLLHSWTEPCCDPEEECSWDYHYDHVLPDGSIEHSWIHTW